MFTYFFDFGCSMTAGTAIDCASKRAGSMLLKSKLLEFLLRSVMCSLKATACLLTVD